ncbi:DUF58 domain-containing protein [Alkalibacillus almallahensis]|uniref:DUF58 domain-containing protein n=1 Tax=Alkalibacillus almallahensis TaxID=1379154 RepID=UPI00141F904B|nr:DUF58 domain-containing protein [Alkalibacillus almallahensis]NIK11706.1 uncharacterized protein (DUF58 family) [Alkalibacillus almallahensis]
MIQSIKTIVTLSLVIALMALLFTYSMFQGGFVSWFLFFSFIPILLYAIFMIFYPMGLMKVERHVHQHYLKAGQTLRVTVTIRRRIPFPLFYLIVEDELPEMVTWHDTKQYKYRFLGYPDQLKNRNKAKTVMFPFLRQKLQFNYEIDAIPRGRHHFNQIKVVTGDLLGFVRREQLVNVDTYVLVEPGEIPLTLGIEQSTFEEGQQSNYTVKANHTNLVSGVRDYAPGDQMSWIDWKTTARKHALVTKEFEEEKQKDLTIILNGHAEDDRRWLAFEAGVELTYSISLEAYEDYGDVSVVALGKIREDVTLKHGKQSFEKLTRMLSQIQMVKENQFAKQLKREAWHLSKDRHLVILTHDLSTSIYQTILQLKQQQVDVQLVFVRSKHLIGHDERHGMDQLHYGGVRVTWLNEDRLTKRQIEVSAS